MSDWLAHAACKGVDINEFFPTRGEDVGPNAMAACERCPVVVRQACLEDALATPSHADFGYRAGTSEKQRTRVRRARDRGITLVPHVTVQRACACGCGETFTAPENSTKRYVDKRHGDVGRDRRGRRRAG